MNQHKKMSVNKISRHKIKKLIKCFNDKDIIYLVDKFKRFSVVCDENNTYYSDLISQLGLMNDIITGLILYSNKIYTYNELVNMIYKLNADFDKVAKAKSKTKIKITKEMLEDIDISRNTGDLATYLAEQANKLYGTTITAEEAFNIFHEDEDFKQVAKEEIDYELNLDKLYKKSGRSWRW